MLLCTKKSSRRSCFGWTLRQLAKIAFVVALVLVYNAYIKQNEQKPASEKTISQTGSSFFSAPADLFSGTGKVTTREELVEKVRSNAEDKPESIQFQFAPALYASISDEDWMTEALFDAGISYASYTYNQTTGNCRLHNIEYIEYTTCYTEAELLAQLKLTGAGESNIRLSAALFEKMKKDDWAALHRLEGQAGITGRDMSFYGAPRYALIYSNVEKAEKTMNVKSVADCKTAFASCSGELAGTFCFACSDAVYSRLIHEDGLLATLCSNAGICDYSYAYSDARNIIIFSKVEYYPGKKLVVMAKNGQQAQFTDRERQLYEAAEIIAAGALLGGGDEYEKVEYIHDAICSKAVYDSEGVSPDHDNAYGALLEGYAECDGYADAFYLAGSLAGLEVYYQHGDDHGQDDSTHMWNMVSLNGKGYFVDLTWDDVEQYPQYVYMNFGSDLAKQRYVWVEEAQQIGLNPATESASYYYTRNGLCFSSVEQAAKHVKQQHEKGERYHALLLRCDNGMAQSWLEELMEKIPYGGSYTHFIAGDLLFVHYLEK